MRAWMHRVLQRWAPLSLQRIVTSDDQRIVFDLSADVGYPLVVKVSPWCSPAPFVWVSETHHEPLAWGEFLAPAGIGWQVLMSTQGEALTRGMPAEVKTLVNAVPFWGMELAQLTGRHPTALDLAASSPLLLVLLTEKAIEQQWSEPYLALHDRRIARFNARNGAQSAVQADMLEKRYGPFPNVPLPNQEGICALTSWNSLLLEGKRMQHCVGSYHSLVAQGSETLPVRRHRPCHTLGLSGGQAQPVCQGCQGVHEARGGEGSFHDPDGAH